MKATVGMKVHVFSPDKKDYLGVGKIIRVENLDVEDEDGNIETLSTSYPIIKLEDGRELGGLDCWWGKVSDQDPNKIVLFDAQDVQDITETLVEYMNLPWRQRVGMLIDYKYQNMKPKNKRMIRMIPRVFILMFFATYFAGFLYSTADLLVYMFGVILLGILLFFVPLNKLL